MAGLYPEEELSSKDDGGGTPLDVSGLALIEDICEEATSCTRVVASDERCLTEKVGGRKQRRKRRALPCIHSPNVALLRSEPATAISDFEGGSSAC